ncbi:MAG: alpha/beta fold hydrolase [Eubacterium sp.]|nr:alpha/beta fold hydrolase [Eubacterium sp.]
MNIKAYNFPSATGVCNIYAAKYTPENGEYDTVLVINHGMAEHQERYLGFIEFLTSNGIAVYMHDMANHGKSNENFDESGWFGEKDGYKALVDDFKKNFDIAKSENPDKKIAVMGHSMGSFICRCLTAWYPDAGYAGAIYMGTGDVNPIAALGDKISALDAKIKGSKHKSKTLDKMSFSSYGKGFEGRTNFDWLTRDNDIVDKYIEDKYCGFLFSAQGMNDLIKLNIAANTPEWYASVPKDLKILLTSGEMDPVGPKAQGIKNINEKLGASGHTNVTLKLYPNCRHEILNELNKDEVMNDILDWLKKL